MIKIFLLSGVLLISGCHLEKPYISPLGVAIQDNAPCFFVPSERVKSLRLAENRGIYVSRKTAQHWVFFWDSPQQATLPGIVEGECLSYPQIKWQEGTYSVLMGASSDNDSERYRLEKTFNLQKDNQGNFLIREAP